MKTTRALVLAAATSVMLVAGCGADRPTAPSVAEPASVLDEGAEPDEDEPTVEPEPTETEPEPEPTPSEPEFEVQTIFNFGETKTFIQDVNENGPTADDPEYYSVTVSEPEGYEPSEYSVSSGSESEEYVRFTITMTNLSEELLSPDEFYSTMQSGGVEATEIFDVDVLGSSPQTSLLPGDTVQWDIGYGVADPEQLTLEVTASYDSQPIIWTNRL